MVPTTSDVWQNWMRWSTAANASPSSSTDEHSSSSYHALLASVKLMGETDTKKKSTLKQIELDLARTSPNDSDFERDGRMIAPLRNILPSAECFHERIHSRDEFYCRISVENDAHIGKRSGMLLLEQNHH